MTTARSAAAGAPRTGATDPPAGVRKRGKVRRPGRRPGATGTRDQILAAAQDAFAEHGYEAATVREIARRAGVDPAMIHHYFGTKDNLLVQVMGAPFDPQEFLATPSPVDSDRLGEHMVRSILRAWDSPAGKTVLIMVRSAVRGSAGAGLLREFVLARVIRPLVAQVEPDPVLAQWRGVLAASQLAGLAMIRYVLAAEPMASAPPEVLVATIGPQVQHYLTGDIPPPPVPTGRALPAQPAASGK